MTCSSYSKTPDEDARMAANSGESSTEVARPGVRRTSSQSRDSEAASFAVAAITAARAGMEFTLPKMSAC